MNKKWTKPKQMWAYRTIDGKQFYCDTSKTKVRNNWAEQGKNSKRIKKVKISWEI